MKEVLMIIASEKYREDELFVTKDEIEKLGLKISIASTIKGKCFGNNGRIVNSDFSINEININHYNAIVYIGGLGCKKLFDNENALKIARDANNSGKIIGAICLAPVILANAGLLKDKNATVFGTEIKAIEKKGAKYFGPGVVVDKNIVTANAPKSSRLFGQTIGKLIG
jgi:protease I